MEEIEKKTPDEPSDLRGRITAVREITKEAKRLKKLAKADVEGKKNKLKTAKKAFKAAKKQAKTVGNKLAGAQKELRELLKKTKPKRAATKP